MKKIFVSFLAVAALVACSKTEPVIEQNEIKLSPVAAKSTKANVFNAIDGTEYPNTENFAVNAYWANEAQGASFTEATSYFADREFINELGGASWNGNPAAYWPKNGSLRFACYSPSSVNGVEHDLATDTYKVEGYTQSAETAKTVDFMLAPTTVSHDAVSGKGGVSVVFEHSLAWITIKVAGSDMFTVNSAVINNVNTKGDLNAVMGTAKTWSRLSEAKNITVSAKDQKVAEEAADYESVVAGTVVIPQEPTTLTLTFSQVDENGEQSLEDQVLTLNLTLGEGKNWEAGKHYVYTVHFGLEEILINPSVADWVDVVVDEIEK